MQSSLLLILGCIFGLQGVLGQGTQVINPSNNTVTIIQADIIPPLVTAFVEPKDVTDCDEFAVTVEVVPRGSADAAVLPIYVEFAIDTSASMNTNDPQDLRFLACNAFIDKLESTVPSYPDLAGITSWADRIKKTYPSGVELTSNLDQLKLAILNIGRNAGQTNPDLALRTSIDRLDSAPDRPNLLAGDSGNAIRIIIFLSDGVPINGEYTLCGQPGSYATEAKNKGYRVFTIGLGEDRDAINLQDLADCTGGEYFESLVADDLSEIFDQIYTIAILSSRAKSMDVTQVIRENVDVKCDESSGAIDPAPTSCVKGGDGKTTIQWQNIQDGTPVQGREVETFQFNVNGFTTDNGNVAINGMSASVSYAGIDGTKAGSVKIPDVSVNVVACPSASPSRMPLPPDAVDDSTTTLPGVPVMICILNNDTDPDGDLDPSSVMVVSNPSAGEVTIKSDSCVNYAPNKGFSGVDTFIYKVCDTTDLCDTATVTISIPFPPVAVDDFARTDQNVPVEICILNNDTDPDGDLDPSSVTVESNPSKGQVVVKANGCVIYSPDEDTDGLDTFEYKVCDLTKLCDIATVTIEIIPAAIVVSTSPSISPTSKPVPQYKPIPYGKGKGKGKGNHGKRSSKGNRGKRHGKGNRGRQNGKGKGNRGRQNGKGKGNGNNRYRQPNKHHSALPRRYRPFQHHSGRNKNAY